MRLMSMALIGIAVLAGCKTRGPVAAELRDQDGFTPQEGVAADWQCSVADESNANRIPVPVTVVSGAEVAEPRVVDYQGTPVSVMYNSGSSFEPQTTLSMQVGDASSVVYDVPNSLHQINANGAFLQCYNEAGRPSGQRIAAQDLDCTADWNGNSERSDLRITAFRGATDQQIDWQEWRGARLAVTFQNGDQFEPQQSVRLHIGDKSMNVYDPGRNLSTFSVGEMRIQCFTGTQDGVAGDDQTPGGNGNGNFADWTCRASDMANGNRQEINVYQSTGAQALETPAIDYNGHQITVHMSLGDRFESQSVLSMNIDGEHEARVYDPTKSLFALQANDVWLQCYYEDGPAPQRIAREQFACRADLGGNQRQANMTPVITSGAQLVDQQWTSFDGYRLGAGLNLGDSFETQQMASLTVDGRSNMLAYDPSFGSLMTLTHDQMRIQCWTE